MASSKYGKDVNNYHENKGPEMMNLFQPRQVLSLDEDLETHFKKIS
jgi:hypothetical protein